MYVGVSLYSRPREREAQQSSEHLERGVCPNREVSSCLAEFPDSPAGRPARRSRIYLQYVREWLAPAAGLSVVLWLGFPALT